MEAQTASTDWHFPVFIVVAFVAFVGVLRLAMHGREQRPSTATILWVSAVVVVGGMAFAKFGKAAGLPVPIYYGVPALLTWLLPPLAFRMRAAETLRYLPMAIVVAPLIHVVFSFLFGWN